MALQFTILTAIGLVLNLAFFSSEAHAREEEKVVALSQGACWVSADSSSRPTRIASFNQQLSLRLTGAYLSSSLKDLEGRAREEFSRGLEWSAGESFIHCSAQAGFFVFNVPLKDSSRNVCAWIELRADSSRLSSWGLSRNGGFCDGVVPGEYVLTLKEGVTRNELDNYLSRVPWRREILELERLSGDHWSLKISASAALESSRPFPRRLVDSKLFRAVERQSFYHPIGEALRIQNPLGR